MFIPKAEIQQAHAVQKAWVPPTDKKRKTLTTCYREITLNNNLKKFKAEYIPINAQVKKIIHRTPSTTQ